MPDSVRQQETPGGHVERPELRAGDLLLVPMATAHGLRSVTGPGGQTQALLLGEFLSADAPLSDPPADSLPEWARELGAVEQAVLRAGTGDGTMVLSDGETCWVAPEDEAAQSALAHPSILTPISRPVGDGQPDLDEVWAFDARVTFGHFSST